MRRFSGLLIILSLIGVIVIGLHTVNAAEINWKAFSKNLVKALRSDNPGLQQSAMQMVIRYGNWLNVKEAEFDVMRVFRNDKDHSIRQLALTTLINMDSKWAVGFLKTQIEFEEDPIIKKQMVAMTSESFKKGAVQEDLAAAEADFNKLQQQVQILSQEELAYTFQTNAKGQNLDASQQSYMLRFSKEKLPPVYSFWSITLYDGETQLQFGNPLNRYLIDSPMMPNLKLDSDGGLTIYIAQQSPGEEKEVNWLPAPDGSFYLIMRLYWPRPEAIDGTWNPPQIQLMD